METRSPKTLLYTLFALVVLIMCWETNLNAAALVTPSIPAEAIRIRILAHSDAPRDQWIKKQVREAMAAELDGWNMGAGTIEEARAVLRDRLPELERVAAETLARYGFTYGVEAELGQVAFPAKVFEGTVYPAGEYEAVRLTLGDGRGENWWCVLFPPLCFGGGTVKAKAGEEESDKVGKETAKEAAVEQQATDEPDAAPAEAGESGKSDTDNHADSKKGQKGNKDDKKDEDDSTSGDEVETRFFFADLFKKVADSIK